MREGFSEIQKGAAMSAITISEEKCVGCSLCVKDCPGFCLYLEAGRPMYMIPVVLIAATAMRSVRRARFV